MSDVFGLDIEQGMSRKQIAEAMQITVSTVNNQKARGILLLRKILSYKGLATLMIIVNSKMFE